MVGANVSLFEQLVAASELSPLFANRALRRALARAGVEPDRMRGDDVAVAAPEIERVVRMFVPDRVDEVMGRIRKLATDR